MATIDLGKVALVWKGTYAAGTTYESKDVVQFTDSGEVSSYIYVNASGASGQTPSTGGTVNTTYWNKMAGGAAGIWASGLALGSAGQVVKVNSGASALEFGDDSGGLASIQTFTTAGSHTWTKPAGIKKVKVTVTGGGGGGYALQNDNDQGGASGGAGGTAIKIIDVSAVSTVSVTVGSSGGGAEGTNGKGNDGTTSSFGSYCSATGGKAGANNNNDLRTGGQGGLGASGDINLNGSSGMSGNFSPADNPNPTGVMGGASYWGGAGGSIGNGVPSGATGANTNGYHGGGGGQLLKSSSGTGGDGGTGIVLVEEFK